MLPSAESGGQCEAGDSTYKAPIVFGVYPEGSQSAIDADIAKYGPYAQGDDGTHEIVFSTFMGDNHRVLTPLTKFGFAIHQGHMSSCFGTVSGQRVECPAPGDPTRVPLPENPDAGSRTTAPNAGVPATRSPQPGSGGGGSATTPQIPSAQPSGAVEFQSPTGNIVCHMSRTGAACEIREHEYATPPSPANCAQYGDRFGLDIGGPGSISCHSGNFFGQQLANQAYGIPVTAGPITCQIDEHAGVRCSDSTTGHYFEVSRQSYQLG
jgi:hypothetical protein